MANPCGCTSTTPQPCCSDCVSNPCDTGCLDIISTACVEHPTAIASIGTVANDKLDIILAAIGEAIEGLQPTAYSAFDYGCLNALSFTTAQEFAEGISDVICEILGIQTPGSITSLSTINTSIQALQTTVNTNINNQTLLAGFITLSGLPGPTATATSLFTALQQAAVDHEADIQTLTSLGVVPLTANDSATIDFTTSGSGNHTLTGSVKLSSAVSNNAITAEADGLHVLSPAITVSDTASIDLTASGVHNHTLQASVKISAVAGNQTILQADGVYTPATSSSETPLTANDSVTIDFTTSGVSNHTITGSVIIDPSVNNLITSTGSGIFVDGTTITVSDNAVTDAKLRDSAANSVIGRASASSGDPADITAAADTVLRRSGSGILGFGTLVTNNIGNDQVTFAKLQNIGSSTLIGRSTAGTGDAESISLGTNLAITAGTINTVGRTLIGVQRYITSDTWNKPAGCNAVLVVTVGGGGGGADAVSNALEACAGGSGGGGAYQLHFLTAGLGATETVTVGTGGVAGTAGGNGGSGTSSSFGAHSLAGGGDAGMAMTSGTSVEIIVGADGGTPVGAATGRIAYGYGSPAGRSIRLSGAVSDPGNGGSSIIGGGEVSNSSFGAGGKGANSVDAGATNSWIATAGGGGIVIVYEYS